MPAERFCELLNSVFDCFDEVLTRALSSSTHLPVSQQNTTKKKKPPADLQAAFFGLANRMTRNVCAHRWPAPKAPPASSTTPT